MIAYVNLLPTKHRQDSRTAGNGTFLFAPDKKAAYLCYAESSGNLQATDAESCDTCVRTYVAVIVHMNTPTDIWPELSTALVKAWVTIASAAKGI